LRKVEAERRSHFKQPPTPLRSQKEASIIHERRGRPFFLSVLISRLYLFRHIPNPFLFYLYQRYLSWLNLDASSLAGLHPKWKFFTALFDPKSGPLQLGRGPAQTP